MSGHAPPSPQVTSRVPGPMSGGSRETVLSIPQNVGGERCVMFRRILFFYFIPGSNLPRSTRLLKVLPLTLCLEADARGGENIGAGPQMGRSLERTGTCRRRRSFSRRNPQSWPYTATYFTAGACRTVDNVARTPLSGVQTRGNVRLLPVYLSFVVGSCRIRRARCSIVLTATSFLLRARHAAGPCGTPAGARCHKANDNRLTRPSSRAW